MIILENLLPILAVFPKIFAKLNFLDVQYMTILRQNYTATTFVSKTIFYLPHEINFVDRAIFLLFLSEVFASFFRLFKLVFLETRK